MMVLMKHRYHLFYFMGKRVSKKAFQSIRKHPKFKKVMQEFHNGTLRNGRTGEIVKNLKMAVAIAISEVKKARKKHAQL